MCETGSLGWSATAGVSFIVAAAGVSCETAGVSISELQSSKSSTFSSDATSKPYDAINAVIKTY